MKRALKLSTLVLVLGITTSVYAEPGQPRHAEGETPAAPISNLRPELRPRTLPDGLLQYPSLINEPAKEVTVALTLNSTPDTGSQKVSKESFEKIQTIVKDNAKFRIEIAACEGNTDPSKAKLASLLDGFHDQLVSALIEKKTVAAAGATGPAPVADPDASFVADEKALVSSVSQILSLLVARGEVLASKEYAPYSSELEKKVASSLKETLNLILGDGTKAEERLEQFKFEAQKADKHFKESVEATEKAVAAVKLEEAGALCLMGAPEKAKEEPLRNEVAKNEPKAKDPATQTDKTPENKDANKAMDLPKYELNTAPLTEMLRRQQEQLAAVTKQGLDEFKRQADEIAKQQAKAAELAKMDDKKKQDELLKALLGKQKEEQKPMQPQQPMAQTAPTPGGMAQQPSQQDPMAGQQQPQQGPQQDPMAQMMQMMAMQQMMNPQQSQSTQPVYQITPSNRWDDIYNTRNNRLSSTATPAADPAKGAAMAQQELLIALRQAGQQQFAAPNAYGQQQGYGGGMMSNRLFSQKGTANTRRNQVNTSGLASLSSTANGPSQLAGSPLGRTSTIPTDLMQGGAATGTGAGLAF